MKTIISSQRTSLSFDYENQRKLMKEERFAGKQNSAGEMGHRIAKHSYDKDQAYNNGLDQLVKSTYYVLDAQGNTMATYERAVDENTLQISFAQTEKFIYGSERLGVQNVNIGLLGSQNNSYSQTTVPHRIGKKGYELSNHLGNVLSVISDKPIPHSTGESIDYYMADIRQATDYSGFGVPNPAYPPAVVGTAVPQGGTAGPYAANIDGAPSNFTFWSTSPKTAYDFAVRGRTGVGVVITIAVPWGGCYPNSSPDKYNEGEVQLYGTQKGIPAPVFR